MDNKNKNPKSPNLLNNKRKISNENNNTQRETIIKNFIGNKVHLFQKNNPNLNYNKNNIIKKIDLNFEQMSKLNDDSNNLFLSKSK